MMECDFLFIPVIVDLVAGARRDAAVAQVKVDHANCNYVSARDASGGALRRPVVFYYLFAGAFPCFR